jgi:hypothetical protein
MLHTYVQRFDVIATITLLEKFFGTKPGLRWRPLHTRLQYYYTSVCRGHRATRRFRISDPCPSCVQCVVRQNRLGGRPARLVQCNGSSTNEKGRACTISIDVHDGSGRVRGRLVALPYVRRAHLAKSLDSGDDDDDAVPITDPTSTTNFSNASVQGMNG